MARWDAAWHRRLREVLADLPARPPEEAASVRRRLSEQDVIAFAVIYMGRHLRGKETDGRVTFAECHYEWARMAQSWRDPVTEPMQHRDAFIAPRAVGKALDVDTPVLTHNRGWVRHGDLASGDVVYDEHGRPCNVLAVRNWGERPCYRMIFSDGGEIVADVAHEWVLTDRNRASSSLYKYETRDIARGFRKDRFVLPPMKGIDGAKVDLPLDPYALGVWLGGRRSIVSVEPTTAETNCISVDSPSQLYLVGENFYATHNSTWWYLIIPLWAAAFGHIRFCAAFAQASSQAVGHLATLRGELDSNPLLRHDFPELCSPARRQTSGTTVADRQGMVHTASGFTFAARGLDSAVLGLKVGDVRPDVLIIDDAEPDESSYSPYLAQKRLTTLTDAIFALNIFARVVMVGTVTMPGSIAHQLVRYGMGDVTEANEWVGDERIRVHHHRAILANGDGTERSIWPQKWPLAWLAQRRDAVSAAARREYAKNYDNDPKAVSGDYWEADDFRYGTLGDLATRWILQVDPAVTTRGSSDWTGLAVVACRPPLVVRRPSSADTLRAVVEQAHRSGLPEWMDPFESQCEVVEARQVKLAGEKLRTDIMRTIVRYPKIRAVRIETNAGGETWRTILHDLPPGVKLIEHSSSVSKEARFAAALTRWHEQRVIHRERIAVLEDQMTGFPRIPHDDVADAVTLAVLFFLHPREEKRQARATVSSYR